MKSREDGGSYGISKYASEETETPGIPTLAQSLPRRFGMPRESETNGGLGGDTQADREILTKVLSFRLWNRRSWSSAHPSTRRIGSIGFPTLGKGWVVFMVMGRGSTPPRDDGKSLMFSP